MFRLFSMLLVVLLLAGCGSGGSISSGSATTDPQIEAFGPVQPGAASPLAPTGLSGASKIASSPPPGGSGPSDGSGTPARPKVTARFDQPVVTNKWWSSLIWQTYTANPWSENLYAHPLAFHAYADGLGVSYPAEPTVDNGGKAYRYSYREDVRVGVPGLAAPDARVDGYSDWTVTASLDDGTRSMLATIGHGLPYACFTVRGGDAEVRCASPPTLLANVGEVASFTVHGHTYGLFAPSGSLWTVNGSTLRSTLAGKRWFSIAILPDNGAATLEYYRQRAYAWVDGTTVSWAYDEASGQLTARYDTHVTVKEPGHLDHPLLALYRHLWLHTETPTTAYGYVSPRGQMKVVDAASFTTRMPFTGVLPNLPDMGTTDPAKLYAWVDSVYAEQLRGPLPVSDTYWTGKALGRLAQLVPIADQVGHAKARDLFLQRIEEKLDDFFDGVAPDVFAYNATWNSLIGYPASYGSDTSLNDHHFHYGYFLMAAATLARYRPAWAVTNAGSVRELVGDVANADRTNLRYPFLRFFDAFAGHCWASGSQPFASGNNQESSSESIDFSSALILWGSATADRAMRDEGIFLYTTEAEAIHQYWLDEDRQVFPSGYLPPTAGMIWGDGAAYATWWTSEVDEIHGINFLPIQPGSVHLGQNPSYVERNYDFMVSEKGGPENEWRDIIWSFLVFAQPETVKSRFLADASYTAESGESIAHTYHWLWNMAALGTPSATVTASIPTFGVFDRDGARTYVAYNPTSSWRTVSFSDGQSLAVAPASFATASGAASAPSPSPSPTPSTSPTPAPSPTPSATPTPAPSPTPSGTPTPEPSPTPSATPTPAPSGAATLYVLRSGSLSGSSGGAGGTDLIPSAGGRNFDGTPAQPLVYEVRNLVGTWRPGQTTAFSLYVDADRNVGDGPQARVSYDFDGDGVADRVETYRYFATNDLPGFELYDQTRGIRAVSGSYADFRGGSVRLEVWNAIGTSAVALRTDASSAEGLQSRLVIPFDFAAAPAPSPTPSPLPSPTPTPTATPTPTPTLGTRTVYLRSDSTLSTAPGALAKADVVASAGGVNHDGTPYLPTVYRLSGLNGTWRSDLQTRFRLLGDAGSHVADGAQVRVSYDFDGDGVDDRVETWRYFALNDLPGWEAWDERIGLRSASGAFRDLIDGTVTVEVWAAIGRDPLNLEVDGGSTITLPFDL
jgi:endoglucanase Acf2